MLYKKHKISTALLVMAILFLFSTFLTIPVFAEGPIDTGLGQSAQKGFGVDDEGAIPFADQGVSGIIGTLIGVVLSFVGVLFLVLMVYGGILWMTARGNEQQVEKAKDLIIASIIGLIIVMGAYAITSFIGVTLAP